MKATTLILLAALLTGCNDRLDEYRAAQKVYPNAKVEPIYLRDCDGFLVVDTNNVARVIRFPYVDGTNLVVVAEINPNATQVER